MPLGALQARHIVTCVTRTACGWVLGEAQNPNTRRSIPFATLSLGLWLGFGRSPKPKHKTKYSIRYTIPRLVVGFWAKPKTQTQDEVCHSLHYPTACGWVLGEAQNPNTRRSMPFATLSHGLWLGFGRSPKPKHKTKYAIRYTIPRLVVGFWANTRRSIPFATLSHGLWLGFGR